MGGCDLYVYESFGELGIVGFSVLLLYIYFVGLFISPSSFEERETGGVPASKAILPYPSQYRTALSSSINSYTHN